MYVMHQVKLMITMLIQVLKEIKLNAYQRFKTKSYSDLVYFFFVVFRQQQLNVLKHYALFDVQ